MPAPSPVPARFLSGPFRRDQFVEAGLSPKLLVGRRFTRVFPNVWTATALTHEQRIQAAVLSLTPRAALSHVTRIQALGLERGPTDPLHFTVMGDHHIDTEGIFLHRTVAMPPRDGLGVTPAAAFVQCCADLRLLDLVVIGDWLLAQEHATIDEIHHVALKHPWRPGAQQVHAVLPWLQERSRSPKESELRALIVACGLPEPEINAPVIDEVGREVAVVDHLFPRWRFALEYEGRQHAEDVRQFARDIARYADLRRLGVDYLQVTAAMLASPRATMTQIHRRLAERGYDGSAPVFGGTWFSLFGPVPVVGTARGAVR
ncbi:hypothetical protein AFL01nite_11700 [Aeromicrobium flavum]|uniref:DUF559 domain-containing protein n=1 Tax=Aeromicrobium flavum TaxID=416568 RepID=A0A512HTQ7_9ACTN|nr:hypothetical protein [Aeromicrobium flavum]GEO88843.1 hypothetical protein AFL01nite_11700 [Aeromicrobium flavum]